MLHVNRGMNMHNRVFEGFASGGFVLARREMNDDHPGGFAQNMAVGREIMLFWTQAELVELVRRAIEDEPWRQGAIAAGRARVLADHTYENRVTLMLSDIRASLTKRAGSE